MKIVKSAVHSFGRWYCREICRREFESQTFRRINERPIEFSFVFRQLTRTVPKKVLDVGTGTTALPDMMRNCGFLVTAIDNVRDYWPSRMFNRHYHVLHDDITASQLSETFDFVSCVSVLEHIEKFDEAIENMFRLLNPNGYLALTFPYNEKAYVGNVYALPSAGYGQDAPYICQVFSRNELDRWINRDGRTIKEQEYWQFWEGEFWTFGKQVLPPLQVASDDLHQLTCILIQKGPWSASVT